MERGLGRVWCVVVTVLVAGLMVLTACSGGVRDKTGENLMVIATTTIIADVVENIAGDVIKLAVLLPTGSDPHTFSPSPRDLVKISEADVMFANGVGLETFLDAYIENSSDDLRIVKVSEAGKLIYTQDGDEHGGYDPHTWTDPTNVMVWVDIIEETLSELDPSHAEIFRANADNYRVKLEELDLWITTQVAQIPPDQRKIVADHQFLSYFAQRYGFVEIGAVIPGTSTLAEPSAQEMAQLEDLIKTEKIGAIFVDASANLNMPERISKDTGVKIVIIHSGSLTDDDGYAGSYLDYMYYNVTAIVDALK